MKFAKHTFLLVYDNLYPYFLWSLVWNCNRINNRQGITKSVWIVIIILCTSHFIKQQVSYIYTCLHNKWCNHKSKNFLNCEWKFIKVDFCNKFVKQFESPVLFWLRSLNSLRLSYCSQPCPGSRKWCNKCLEGAGRRKGIHLVDRGSCRVLSFIVCKTARKKLLVFDLS